MNTQEFFILLAVFWLTVGYRVLEALVSAFAEVLP